jgi:stage V sporulation protein B
MGPNGDIARTAGRGVLYITSAKIFFIAAGYAIHFSLPRLLEAKELYGIYGVVVSLVNVLNMVLVQGAVQAVSKLVSESEARSDDVRKAALKVQAWVGGGLAIAYAAGAGLIADFQRDPSLALYYRVSALVVLFYGFYAVFIGVLNGRREFRSQALFDVSYATLKMGLIVAAAALGFSILGVFAGFAVASALVAIAAAVIVGLRGGRSSREIERRLLAFMLPVMAYTLVLNVLLTLDLWLLKALLPAEGVKEAAADYTAAQVISRIPYQATLSITFVVFPLISRATFEGDRAATQAFIRVALRYSLIALAGMVAILGGAAGELVVIAYPSAYGTAAPALEWLSGAMLLYAVFAILGAIINGSGRATLSLWLGLGALAVDLALCRVLIPVYGAQGAAAATGLALLCATAAGLFALWRLFGAGLPALSAVRVGAAAAAVVALAVHAPTQSKLVTVAKCLGLAALYFALLVATRELGREDLARVRRVFARRASAAKEVP